MGLDDFTSTNSSTNNTDDSDSDNSTTSSIGSKIEAEKELDNVTLGEDTYEKVLTRFPLVLSRLCDGLSNSDTRAVLEKADELIDNSGTEDITMSKVKVDALKQGRDEVVAQRDLGNKRYN